MFGSIGGPELLLILVVALLVFGPKRLPELGRSVGRGLREFRRATMDLQTTIERELAESESSGGAQQENSIVTTGVSSDSRSAGGNEGGRNPA